MPGYNYTTDPQFVTASAIDQKAYLMHVDPDFAKANPKDQGDYLSHIKGLDQPTQFEQQRKIGPVTDALGGVAQAIPAPIRNFIGKAGAGAGEAMGVNVNSPTPIRDALSGLNQQVNQAATTPWSQGGPVYGTLSMLGRGLESAAKNIPSGIKEGGVKGAAKAITSGALLGSVAESAKPDTAEPSTVGMRQGGTAGAVEKIANRIPVASAPLKKVYAQVADNFRSTVNDAVEQASGIKGDSSDPVGTLNSGSQALKAQSKPLYKAVDDYIKTNNVGMVNQVVQSLAADPDILRNMPTEVYEHPINGIKQAIDALQQKGRSALSSRPIDAHSYFSRAQDMQGVLDQVTQGLPSDIKASYDQAQSLYAKHAAMKDIADTFDKSVEGLPPSKQPSGLAKTQQAIKGSSLLENLKSEPRLRQAFGSDVADAIVQHSARLSSAQSLQGGSSLIGGLYGTSILVRAVGGVGMSTIPGELGGIYLLSKVLASPASHPFYANMLRATTLAEQDFWAKQALAKADK